MNDIKSKITRARELCEAATDGPWSSADLFRSYDVPISEADSNLIDAASTLLPELADALEVTLGKLAIHEGGLRSDALKALNRQPELEQERDEAQAKVVELGGAMEIRDRSRARLRPLERKLDRAMGAADALLREPGSLWTWEAVLDKHTLEACEAAHGGVYHAPPPFLEMDKCRCVMVLKSEEKS